MSDSPSPVTAAEPERATDAAPPAAQAGLVPSGVPQQLDRRVITVDRLIGAITTAVMAFILLIVDLILLVTGGVAAWALVFVLPGSLLAVILIAWLSWVWPALDYRHASYVIDADGVEIRRGVVFRRVINVPRSRVQHIDVSQGPIERAYGLGTMSIYTAGTEYAQVGLSGLDHAVALHLRDRLLPKESQDAV